jgi:hypothetical protein
MAARVTGRTGVSIVAGLALVRGRIHAAHCGVTGRGHTQPSPGALQGAATLTPALHTRRAGETGVVRGTRGAIWCRRVGAYARLRVAGRDHTVTFNVLTGYRASRVGLTATADADQATLTEVVIPLVTTIRVHLTRTIVHSTATEPALADLIRGALVPIVAERPIAHRKRNAVSLFLADHHLAGVPLDVRAIRVGLTEHDRLIKV